MSLLKSKSCAAVLIVAQLAFFTPSAFAEKTTTSVLDMLKTVDAVTNTNDSIELSWPSPTKISKDIRNFTNIEKNQYNNAIELARQYKDAEKAGNIEKQNTIRKNITEFLSNNSSNSKIHALIEVFIAFKIMEYAWSKTAGKMTPVFKTVLRTVVTLRGGLYTVIAGEAIAVGYLSYQLGQLSRLSSTNNALGRRAQAYENTLRRLLLCRDSVSVAHPCIGFTTLPGFTTEDGVNKEIERISHLINGLFEQERMHFNAVVPSTAGDRYTPRDGIIRFHYLNPIINTWRYINPF